MGWRELSRVLVRETAYRASRKFGSGVSGRKFFLGGFFSGSMAVGILFMSFLSVVSSVMFLSDIGALPLLMGALGLLGLFFGAFAVTAATNTILSEDLLKPISFMPVDARALGGSGELVLRGLVETAFLLALNPDDPNHGYAMGLLNKSRRREVELYLSSPALLELRLLLKSKGLGEAKMREVFLALRNVLSRYGVVRIACLGPRHVSFAAELRERYGLTFLTPFMCL